MQEQKWPGEYEIMRLADHANFATTHQFYLALTDDLTDRTQAVASAGIGQDLACAHCFGQKGLTGYAGSSYTAEV